MDISLYRFPFLFTLWELLINLWFKQSSFTLSLNPFSCCRHCNGYTYFFSGAQYWRFNDLGCCVDLTYPQPSSSNWLGLPDNITIDGMFVWSNGVLYIFSGDDYYGFNQTTQTLIFGFPKKIAPDWPGIPNDIQAVFRWGNKDSLAETHNTCLTLQLGLALL